MPRKKSKASTKGSAFERQICKELSLWWTYEDRDDIFWRTSNSGGRAIRRSKKKKQTFGQYGDIQAVDPIGQPLMDVLTFELKCGYPGVSVLDGFESGLLRGRTLRVEQAKEAAHLADGGAGAVSPVSEPPDGTVTTTSSPTVAVLPDTGDTEVTE